VELQQTLEIIVEQIPSGKYQSGTAFGRMGKGSSLIAWTIITQGDRAIGSGRVTPTVRRISR
jgi:hypothetical protein